MSSSPAPGATAHNDDEAEHNTTPNKDMDGPALRQVRTNSSNQLALPLHIPKNRSTGNLLSASSASSDVPDHKARIRFSFDAGASAAEYDAATRLVPLPTALSPSDLLALTVLPACTALSFTTDPSYATPDETEDVAGRCISCTDPCLCIAQPFVQDRYLRRDDECDSLVDSGFGSESDDDKDTQKDRDKDPLLTLGLIHTALPL